MKPSRAVTLSAAKGAGVKAWLVRFAQDDVREGVR